MLELLFSTLLHLLTISGELETSVAAVIHRNMILFWIANVLFNDFCKDSDTYPALQW